MNSSSLQDEMTKNPDLKKEDIKALQEWKETQPHLPKIYDTDFALFLHSNYYDIKKAMVNIENYYSMRMHLPEFFSNRDPIYTESLRRAFDTVSIIPLEKRTKEGYKVILARLIDTDESNYMYNDAVKFFNMVLDICVYEEGTSSGYIFVFDLNGTNPKHSTRLSMLGLKKFFQYLQEGSPIRWIGAHYINTGKVADKVTEFIKARIIDNQYLKTLHLHSTLESVGEVIPLDILPNEQGGKAGPVLALHKAEIKKLESYRDWFLKMETRCKVDEDQRPGERQDARTLFGAEEGDFKNLDMN